MSRKIAGLIAMTIVATSQASAGGSLEKQYIHCSGGYKRYALVWEGPWSEGLIFMERKCSWRGDWDYDFWIGYLAASGTYFPAGLDYDHRMMAQPVGGTAYKDSIVQTIHSIPCSVTE